MRFKLIIALVIILINLRFSETHAEPRSDSCIGILTAIPLLSADHNRSTSFQIRGLGNIDRFLNLWEKHTREYQDVQILDDTRQALFIFKVFEWAVILSEPIAIRLAMKPHTPFIMKASIAAVLAGGVWIGSEKLMKFVIRSDWGQSAKFRNAIRGRPSSKSFSISARFNRRMLDTDGRLESIPSSEQRTLQILDERISTLVAIFSNYLQQERRGSYGVFIRRNQVRVQIDLKYSRGAEPMGQDDRLDVIVTHH